MNNQSKSLDDYTSNFAAYLEKVYKRITTCGAKDVIDYVNNYAAYDDSKYHNSDIDCIDTANNQISNVTCTDINDLKQQVKDLQRQLNELSEEEQVRVQFFYTYVSPSGYKQFYHEKDTISLHTYNSLISGGEYAITSYIHSNLCFLENGASIIHARMMIV